jgi:hypothetical protein
MPFDYKTGNYQAAPQPAREEEHVFWYKTRPAVAAPERLSRAGERSPLA